MAKDFKQGMAHGLSSLTQNPAQKPAKEAEPTTAAKPLQAEDPQQEVEQAPKTPKTGSGTNAKQQKQAVSSVTSGLRAGYTRATIIAKQDTLAKIREIAYLEREHAMDIVEAALAGYLEKYEAEHGKVKVPKKKK